MQNVNTNFTGNEKRKKTLYKQIFYKKCIL